MQVDKMSNEALRKVFGDMHSEIVKAINPNSVIDALVSKDVIKFDDYSRLCRVRFTGDRCRDLLLLLQRSSHPQTFIHLRLALLSE